MDKHERVAEDLFLKGQGVATDPDSPMYSPNEMKAISDIASILRKEYGSERNAALEEAAKTAEGLTRPTEMAFYDWKLSHPEMCQYGLPDSELKILFHGSRIAKRIRALKSDHISEADGMVSLPRDIAESLRHYLAQQIHAYGMDTTRAEADGMDDELSALNEALGRKS